LFEDLFLNKTNNKFSAPKENVTCPLPDYVNCALKENLCHECCNGSFVDGTYVLPPGMYYTACYPGINDFVEKPLFAHFTIILFFSLPKARWGFQENLTRFTQKNAIQKRGDGAFRKS
jgi:hypothetical protein